MHSMFETLLQLPLFQGMTEEDLTSILGKVKLHFTKYKPGEYLLKAGTTCNRFEFLLRGEVAAITTAPHNKFCVFEYFQAPHVLEPYSLFGMETCFGADYIAVDEVHTVSIDKSFILGELFKYEIFRLSYTNLLCNRAQQLNKRIWSKAGAQTEKRIAAFILHHVERPAGKKIIKIKMEELAGQINVTRLSVSKALNDLEEKGVIELHRGEIIVPEAKLLMD
ncbi:MAG: Crp/Fnr family transcriptional regulator [Bacteroides sp.]|nr:Crp/Fnr family transcriptional regulator [Bacteroides sp.]